MMDNEFGIIVKKNDPLKTVDGNYTWDLAPLDATWLKEKHPWI